MRPSNTRVYPISVTSETPFRSLARFGAIIPGIPFILALGLLPVYLFPSGLPQLVDIPIVSLIFYHLVSRTRNPGELKNNFFLLFLFVIWVFLVNCAYFLIIPQDYLPLFKNLESVYSFLILLTFSALFIQILKSQDIKYIYFGLLLSTIMVFLAKGYREEEFRATLSFNNPNQLGYFSIYLASMSILLMVYKDTYNINNKIYLIFDVFIIIIAHIMVILSWSRGAILGVICLDIFLLFKMPKKALAFLVPGIIGVVILLVWRPAIIQERLHPSASKPISPEVAKQELEARLFYQLSLLRGIEYLVGRGGRSLTFKEKAQGYLDVHNIFGEIFRSYGLVGLTFFSLWLGRTIWQTRVVPGALWIWAGFLIYNMSHYGLRFRSFWIFTAFICVLSYSILQKSISSDTKQ